MKKENLTDRFLAFIDQHKLIEANDKLLLAVSGGVDSVVLTQLFSLTAFHFDMAHVNFQLRGEDAIADEEFVRSLAGKYQAKLHLKRFETLAYAERKKVSVEMAARELRYNWFDQLSSEHGFHKVVLGHHLNDQLETVLLHFAKGSGIRGIRGMQAKRDHYVRPLLFARREEIEAYAKSRKLEFREDKTNQDTNFQRNLIRHNVVPELKKINPSLEEAIQKSSELTAQAESFIGEMMEIVLKHLCHWETDKLRIDTLKLSNYRNKAFILYEILKDFGFNESGVKDILVSLSGQPGKEFFSAGHKAILDRGFIMVKPLGDKNDDEYFLFKGQKRLKTENGSIEIEELDYDVFGDLRKPHVAYLDKAQLEYPLLLRRWKDGDYFYPFGMNKRKKISDFLTDEKVDVHKRKDIYVLLSGEKIAWVIGMRVDNRFRIGPGSEKVHKLVLK